ncbi:MAG: xanthine dehydrogenase family protein molybdopterin-binding subunit [Alphaproteobacteria bacterium]|nr:xanthine dehydrogenase family protein molybdopterin-binding subunit [Alphaproteobacteria bacterium]MCB9699424.1 xanthine dehydrogenase family protein molybdopterin-binding subunit [Alphaproteobacteria bacterium]
MTTRRAFLLGLAASGLLAVATPSGAWAAPADFVPHAWIRVSADGTVALTCHRSEMGQGVRSSLPALLAYELGADPARIEVVQADGDPAYGDQDTDGSRSVRTQQDLMRRLGAVGRIVLERVGARRLGVPVAAVTSRDHAVWHEPSGRGVPFGDLATEAAAEPLPDRVTLRADPPASGWDLPLVDAHAQVTGAARYVADIVLEGQCTAVIVRPPVLGSSVVSFDDTEARAVPGVVDVIELPAPSGPPGFQPLGGVAVVAEDTWTAKRAAERLRVTWSQSPHDGASWTQDLAAMREAVARPGTARRTRGDAEGALGSAAKRLDATYVVPHLAHAALEPPCAVARRTEDGCEVWASTQTPQAARSMVAEVLGLDEAKVTVHVPFLGAAFGRKSKPDFAVEAALLADRVRRPVRVQWLREDAMRQGYVHACSVQRLEAGLDGDGRLVAWRHRIASPTIASTFGDAHELRDSELGQGIGDQPLEVPALSVETHPVQERLRIGWMRSVYNINHAFAIQSFLDELAHARDTTLPDLLKEVYGPPRRYTPEEAGAEIWNYGASLDEHPIDVGRYHRVIDRVRALSRWDEPAPEGRARGFAVHRSFLTYVAVVVELSRGTRGGPRLERAWVVADPGRIVNRDRVRAQLEGAVVFGATVALHGRLTLEDGRVREGNFHDYRLLRMNEAPRSIDVELITEGEPHGGVGEPGVPPVAPAIANAWFALTGERVRELPLT